MHHTLIDTYSLHYHMCDIYIYVHISYVVCIDILYVVCVCVWRETYCEALSCEVTEADKSQYLRCESASWTPRRAGGMALVWVWGPRIRRVSAKVNQLWTQEELIFQLHLKAGKISLTFGRISFFVLFKHLMGSYSGYCQNPQWRGWSALFSLPIQMFLRQKHAHRHTQNMFDQISGHLWSSQVDT
jgi:hypothetical protein